MHGLPEQESFAGPISRTEPIARDISRGTSSHSTRGEEAGQQSACPWGPLWKRPASAGRDEARKGTLSPPSRLPALDPEEKQPFPSRNSAPRGLGRSEAGRRRHLTLHFAGAQFLTAECPLLVAPIRPHLLSPLTGSPGCACGVRSEERACVQTNSEAAAPGATVASG